MERFSEAIGLAFQGKSESTTGMEHDKYSKSTILSADWPYLFVHRHSSLIYQTRGHKKAHKGGRQRTMASATRRRDCQAKLAQTAFQGDQQPEWNMTTQ